MQQVQDCFWWQELKEVLVHLIIKIETLEGSIVAEGSLHKNKSGSYQIDDNHYFTSGSPIEILYHNDFYEQHFGSEPELNTMDTTVRLVIVS